MNLIIKGVITGTLVIFIIFGIIELSHKKRTHRKLKEVKYEFKDLTVSIVIPCRNEKNYIRKCIDSFKSKLP